MLSRREVAEILEDLAEAAEERADGRMFLNRSNINVLRAAAMYLYKAEPSGDAEQEQDYE